LKFSFFLGKKGVPLGGKKIFNLSFWGPRSGGGGIKGPKIKLGASYLHFLRWPFSPPLLWAPGLTFNLSSNWPIFLNFF